MDIAIMVADVQGKPLIFQGPMHHHRIEAPWSREESFDDLAARIESLTRIEMGEDKIGVINFMSDGQLAQMLLAAARERDSMCAFFRRNASPRGIGLAFFVSNGLTRMLVNWQDYLAPLGRAAFPPTRCEIVISSHNRHGAIHTVSYPPPLLPVR